MKCVKNFLVLVAAMLLSAASAQAEILYSVTDLGSVGSGSQVLGISASGQVVGFGSTGALHWDGTQLNNLGAFGFSGGYNAVAYDVNDSGHVLGYYVKSGVGYTVLRSGESTSSLFTGEGHAINNAGQVAGATNAGEPCFYEPGVGLTTLPSLGGGLGRGINASGQVAGETGGHIASWTNGILQDLGTGAAFGGTSGFANGLNDAGQIVGAFYANGQARAWLWSNAAETNLHPLIDDGSWTSTYAKSINSSGQVVGLGLLGGAWRGFLYSNGEGTDLTALIDPASGVTVVNQAAAINDFGQIAARGVIGGSEHFLLLSPIPEPSTFVLLAGGLVCLLGYARRRYHR